VRETNEAVYTLLFYSVFSAILTVLLICSLAVPTAMIAVGKRRSIFDTWSTFNSYHQYHGASNSAMAVAYMSRGASAIHYLIYPHLLILKTDEGRSFT